MERDISYGGIIRRTFGLVADDWLVALGLIASITAVATLIDLYAQGISGLLGIPLLVIKYYSLRRLIDEHGLRSAESHAGFGSFFAVGVMTGIAIMLGFVFFIVPGIYLSARWAMANAALLAENGTSREALDRSWAATNGHALPVALTIVTLTLPSLVIMGLTLSPLVWANTVPDISLNQSTSIAITLAVSLCVYVPQVISWYFGVALYALLIGRPGDQLSEVFA